MKKISICLFLLLLSSTSWGQTSPYTIPPQLLGTSTVSVGHPGRVLYSGVQDFTGLDTITFRSNVTNPPGDPYLGGCKAAIWVNRVGTGDVDYTTTGILGYSKVSVPGIHKLSTMGEQVELRIVITNETAVALSVCEISVYMGANSNELAYSPTTIAGKYDLDPYDGIESYAEAKVSSDGSLQVALAGGGSLTPPESWGTSTNLENVSVSTVAARTTITLAADDCVRFSCDLDAFFLLGGSSVTATTTNAVRTNAREIETKCLPTGVTKLSFITASGTGTCQVVELTAP